MLEVKWQRSSVRGQMLEVGGQRLGVSAHLSLSEVRSQMSSVRGQVLEVRWQRSCQRLGIKGQVSMGK